MFLSVTCLTVKSFNKSINEMLRLGFTQGPPEEQKGS